MSKANYVDPTKNVIMDRFVKRFLPNKKYLRHSDIDLYLNLKITALLNYTNLLTDEDNKFISQNFGQNYKHLEEINTQKKNELLKLTKSFSTLNEFKLGPKTETIDKEIVREVDKEYEDQNKQKKKRKEKIIEKIEVERNSILTFTFPQFEIYLVAKLFVNGMAIEPEYTTKLIFSQEMEQQISLRYKYKDLTPGSYIKLSIFSVQLPEDKSLLGSTTISLFDNNFNVTQGKHMYKIYPKIDVDVNNIYDGPNENSNQEEENINKEIDLLTFTYNSTKDQKIKTYEKANNRNNDDILKFFRYNQETKMIEKKDDYLIDYETKLNYLLTKTQSCFVEVQFPSFNNPVIFDEDISPFYNRAFKRTELKIKSVTINYDNWICDPQLHIEKGKEKDFLTKNNPITEKFSILSRAEDDAFAHDLRPTPYDSDQINETLNIPDFIELSHLTTALFWKYRYELLKSNKKSALTKILSSIKWGDQKSENEGIKNILYNWNGIELCDLLFMLSAKFSLNSEYFEGKGAFSTKGFKDVRSYAVQQLAKVNDEDLNFILLQLVQALRYEDHEDSPLKEFLIDKCSKSVNLATSLYWFLEVEKGDGEKKTSMENKYEIIFRDFFKKLEKNKEVYEKINSQIKFRDLLVEISKYLKKEKKADAKKELLRKSIKEQGNFYERMQTKQYSLPIDPNLEIKGTDPIKCTVFKSAMCPIKYSFNVTPETQKDNQKEDQSKFDVMFKFGDDLRQDQLILQIFNYMDRLLKKVHLDYEFTTYKVLATSKTDGFVEFVPNSTTIFDILKQHKNQITPFLKKDTNETEYKKKLASFINSCAGYCVVTYLLGIGDRHLENLLIDKNGRLFHIDFGYILGKDPKPMPPPIKLCKEMIECMGGKNSEGYKEFKNKCVNAYWMLRDNSRLIVNMFYLMKDSGIPELNNLEALKKLNEKFSSDKTRQEASNSLLNKLEESVNAFFPGMMETFHSWAVYFR